MKTKLLLFILLIGSIGQTAAQCEKKKDKFTGSISITGELTKIGKCKSENCQSGFLKASVVKNIINDTSGIYTISFLIESGNVFSMTPEDKIYVRFTDESVLEFDNKSKTNIASPQSGEAFSQGSKNTIWVAEAVIIINSYLKEFKTKSIFAVRCGSFVYEVKENRAMEISQQLMCIDNLK